MRTGLKVWLWIVFAFQIIGLVSSIMALVNKDTLAMVIAMTGMDPTAIYIVSIITGIITIIGILIMLFMKKKLGFWIICASCLISGVYGILTATGATAVVTIISNIIGIVLLPGITYLLMKKDWDTFK